MILTKKQIEKARKSRYEKYSVVDHVLQPDDVLETLKALYEVVESGLELVRGSYYEHGSLIVIRQDFDKLEKSLRPFTTNYGDKKECKHINWAEWDECHHSHMEPEGIGWKR